jgi:hypothetical protein
VSEKSPYMHLNALPKDKDIQVMDNQHTLLIKALMALPLSTKKKEVPKALQKLYRLKEDYQINQEIDEGIFKTDPDLSGLRKEIQKSILKVRADIDSTNRKITHNFIEGRVEAIRSSRCEDPGKFFARAQPDSVFRNQQLWAVDYLAKRKRKDGSSVTITTSSSIPTIVSREVKKAWEKVFSSRKPITTELHTVFNSEKFKERREKIHHKDDVLTQLITKEEVISTLKKLSNGTACGPDNIPNEILKHMGVSPKFIEVLTHMLNASMVQNKIPSTWKKSSIFTVYKKDNPNNPLNYRPIALLCTTYKLYSTIITGRLNNFMEENKCFSEMQGGFRRDRPTFAKMWTLRNIFEHAKKNDRELHACYIDIQKAYDSVEHWALDRVLEEYGFSQHFRDIITDICKDTTCNVILPHGLSDSIKITRGVRQGCPLSPVLFILFLEPMMLKLEGMKRGYKLDEGDPIPGGAYADDMVLHAGTRIDLQRLLNECAKYFEFVGLDIAADGRDKSVYTSNTGPPSASNRLHFTTHKNGVPEVKYLPYYESDESYKYLGLWINLDLDWEKQTRISNAMYSKYICYLYKKCFTASQTAEILNLVVFPAITYRMNLINYPGKTIQKWDQKARSLMAYKLHESQFIGCKQWYLTNNQYGYNLFKLADLQKICLPANFLSYSANFIDSFAVRATRAVFDDSEVIEQVRRLLSKYKLHVVWNPAWLEGFDPEHPSKYIPNSTLLKNLCEAGVENMNHIIQNDNEPITLEEFNERFDTNWPTRKHNHLKKQLCNKNDQIKESILKGLDRYQPWEFNPGYFHFDEEMGGYEIYVDETLKQQKGKPDKAGYGIHIGKKHQYNFYDRVEGEQTLQNATYQGILHVLKGFPLDEPILFGIDRKAVIDVMENFPKAYKDKQSSLHLDTLNQIKEVLEQRTAPIIYKHIYSHTNENHQDADTLDSNLKKKEKMISIYGEERTDRYIQGNMGADKLADKAMLKPDIHTIPFNKYQNEFLIQSTRKKVSKKNSFKGVINTRVRKELKKIIRVDFAEDTLSKDKYDTLKQYEGKISKNTTHIMKTKLHTVEKEKKMMIRMIHGSLPTCEKINRLVQASPDFFSEKYAKVTNNGLCPCCGEAPETIRHLFMECQHPDISETREYLTGEIQQAIKNRLGPGIPLCPKFYYDNDNKTEPNSEWDPSLGNLGLVPTTVEKWLLNHMDEEQRSQIKYLICEISQAIMKLNIDIWKTRCKKLYATQNNSSQPP